MDDEQTTDILRENGWTFDQALDRFTSKSHDALHRSQKTAIVWQEMVRHSVDEALCGLADAARYSTIT
jgi:hypothetical protein